MFKRLFAAALVLGAAALAPPLATAETGLTPTAQPSMGLTCVPRAQLIETLERKYGESKQGVGLLNAQQAFELWSSRKTGSWTMLISRADGVSCILASGNSWQGKPILVGEPA